ncbi:anti-sigma factor [Desulfosporosinus youngiae]|uniref:Sigma factor regulator C-terminal domain-containing protein n=1 Tax=Desulfosporosinus youngiae DSM 17734 TaxID=768710 RepID=H5Y320_9FIRM|nr:anti-sigma factor [Desulfosporosinus youngiae]EHQ88715.1 hypothetical protein DesyoDRAFT_1580 [Desulfosporosinus youngiae DSM 17734]
MGDKLNDNELDQIFDEDKLDRAIKKGKQKSTKRTVLISLLVACLAFLLITAGNAALTINMSNKTFQTMSAYIELTVPNGYISKSVDTFGFLGGRSNYTISRTIGNKPAVLEERVQPFGLLPQFIMTRGRGGGHSAGDWPSTYWEFGYNKMIFFHPQITYKEYKNDLANLSQIGNDKLIEVGLSFDKPYTISELANILPGVNISWCWIDSFTKDEMNRYKKEAEKYDAKATFISEFDTLGFNLRPSADNENFGTDYNSFLYNLKISSNQKFLAILDSLTTKGYTDPSKVPILGAIVYGTKDQLESLLGNSHIKASSFGVITEKY